MMMTNLPRSWTALLVRLLAAVVAAVPPYLVLSYSGLSGISRVVVAMVSFIPGAIAILWAARR
jgi:hypothetical protein